VGCQTQEAGLKHHQLCARRPSTAIAAAAVIRGTWSSVAEAEDVCVLRGRTMGVFPSINEAAVVGDSAALCGGGGATGLPAFASSSRERTCNRKGASGSAPFSKCEAWFQWYSHAPASATPPWPAS
jgi:hypothetical protein